MSDAGGALLAGIALSLGLGCGPPPPPPTALVAQPMTEPGHPTLQVPSNLRAALLEVPAPGPRDMRPPPPSPAATVAMGWAALPGGTLRSPWWGAATSVGEPADDGLFPVRVDLAPFEIMTTEATVGMYRACVAQGGCDAAGLTVTVTSAGENPEWAENCAWRVPGTRTSP